MNWDYIAGFVDGEGSITKRKLSYTIYISQTNREVLEEIRRFAGVGHVYALTKRKAHWKDAWLYTSGDTKETSHVLSHIVEKLIVKKDLALRALSELGVRIAEADKTKKTKRERLRAAKLLREKGWSYRKIGAELHTDWGYIRRILLEK